MSALALAIRFARRELRSGLSGFRIFLAALTLGVAAIAGVGSLGEAFLTGLSEQGRTLLGGDVRLQRLYQPATEAERQFMSGYGAVSESATLRSMATAANDPAKTHSGGAEGGRSRLSAARTGGARARFRSPSCA